MQSRENWYGNCLQAADVWSCGVLLYIMIASAYPFGRPEDEPLAPAQKMQVMLQVRHIQGLHVGAPAPMSQLSCPRPYCRLASGCAAVSLLCRHPSCGYAERGNPVPASGFQTDGSVLMAQRILAVNYELPGHVAMSADCRDLLSRILVADPARRITVPAILRHPWFLRGLPDGVAEMNDRLVPPRASEIRTFSMPDGVQARASGACRHPGCS